MIITKDLKLMSTKPVLLHLITITFSLLSSSAFSDSGTPEMFWEKESSSRVAAVDNEQYKQSCGTCHDAIRQVIATPVLGKNSFRFR